MLDFFTTVYSSVHALAFGPSLAKQAKDNKVTSLVIAKRLLDYNQHTNLPLPLLPRVF